MSAPVEEEEDAAAASPGFSCVSLKSHWSKDNPLDFSNEPGPPETRRRKMRKRRKKSGRCGAALQPASHTQTDHKANDGLQELLQQQKISLERRCERVTEGEEAGSQTLLNSIYTEVYITEGLSEEVNRHHEVRKLETRKTTKTKETEETKEIKESLYDRPIRCSQIFEASPEQQGLRVRVALTNGVASQCRTVVLRNVCLNVTLPDQTSTF
ncbi:uncharacterized protein LOC142888935 [Nelusetta ayraudi]|uniref:uncharacterized protein LOC142888935 n=1 Tax=Nelusetta ayraudi TaxID=303726 RepID=UPI003F6FE3DB